jgi:hypothetical protein
MKGVLAGIQRVNISKEILSQTLAFLQMHGRKQHEGHGIWVGRDIDDVFDVADVWFPKQRNTVASYEVSAEEIHRLNVRLSSESMTIIAQVHSHPSGAFHSYIDDEYSSLSLPGSFSVVVPDFGFVECLDDLNQYAVFRYTGSRWIPVNKPKVRRIFKLT